MSLSILSTGSAVPERFVCNDELSKFLDTSDEWITSKTGIKTRAVCTAETLTDLSVKAAETAIKRAAIDPALIDLCICSTICGDFVMPSLACAVIERLSLSCPAFDINAACTGFVYALDIAAAYIAAGKARYILIISADRMSAQVDWTDRNLCVLFGDGAGACVVTAGDSLKYIHLTAKGDTTIIRQPAGTGNSPFAANPRLYDYFQMDGQEVFKFAVSAVERECSLAVSKTSARPIDFFILHQANKRIIDSVRKRMGESESKFPVNIDKYGNTSSASVPILLDEMNSDGRLKRGNILLITAFGAGVTTGTCVIEW